MQLNISSFQIAELMQWYETNVRHIGLPSGDIAGHVRSQRKWTVMYVYLRNTDEYQSNCNEFKSMHTDFLAASWSWYKTASGVDKADRTDGDMTNRNRTRRQVTQIGHVGCQTRVSVTGLVGDFWVTNHRCTWQRISIMVTHVAKMRRKSNSWTCHIKDTHKYLQKMVSIIRNRIVFGNFNR